MSAQNVKYDDVFVAPEVLGLIIVSYLIFVLQLGPRYMKNRPAYKLNNFLRFYNIFQVLSCLYLIGEIWDLTNWDVLSQTKCINYFPNTVPYEKFNKIAVKTFALKIIELVDTIIFVLRKKQNQITYLHVFHHSATITLCYTIMTFSKNSGALFPLYLNSWVHVVMYTYYFFANICSVETMRKFIYIKKSITIIQMIQFCLILINAAALWSVCQIPTVLKYYYCMVICVIFYGFYDFYKKAYSRKQELKK